MPDTKPLPKRLPGVTLFHIIQHLNEKYHLAMDVMFAIPEGDQSIYFHDPASGSVAIFACFAGKQPNLIYFCMKSQIFTPMDLAAINVEISCKFFPPVEEVPERKIMAIPWYNPKIQKTPR